MPHQCTECARTFPDGSKEMLSGCPDCGGNKFQFKPSDAVDVGAGGGADSGDAGRGGVGGGVADGSSGGGDSGAMSRAKATVRDLMGRGDGDDGTGSAAGESPSHGGSANAGEMSNPGRSANASETPSPGNASASASDASAGAGDAASSAASESESSGSPADGSPPSDGVDTDGDRVTPSGSGEWPKSATEEYDTPAEQARRRESHEESGGTTESRASERGAGTAESASGASESASGTSESASGTSESASDDESITAQMGETEDDAQRSARSDVVSPDELPSRESAAPGGMRDDAAGEGSSERVDRPPSSEAADVKDRPSAGDVASEPDDDSPNLDELREELNSQFESIKVLDPGKYELNLMELYDREEYIISLQEDGRYVIEVPESWRGDASPD